MNQQKTNPRGFNAFFPDLEFTPVPMLALPKTEFPAKLTVQLCSMFLASAATTYAPEYD